MKEAASIYIKTATSIFVKVAAFYKIFHGLQKELIMLIKLFYGI